MPRTRCAAAGVILAMGLAATSGCSQQHESTVSRAQTQPPAAPAPSNSAASGPVGPATLPPGILLAYVWDCDDGTSLTMDNLLAERAIALQLPDGPRRLPQVVAASGVKYDDGAVSFWTKGNTAMLQRKDGPVVNCTESRPKSLLADARTRGVTYRGAGNEPGWVLEIVAPDRLVFVTNYGQDRHEFDGAAVSGNPESGAKYQAADGGQSIRAMLKLEPCQDDMAGTPFDYSLIVEFGGRTYRGCAASTR
jgi:putative lipoprotein